MNQKNGKDESYCRSVNDSSIEVLIEVNKSIALRFLDDQGDNGIHTM